MVTPPAPVDAIHPLIAAHLIALVVGAAFGLAMLLRDAITDWRQIR